MVLTRYWFCVGSGVVAFLPTKGFKNVKKKQQKTNTEMGKAVMHEIGREQKAYSESQVNESSSLVMTLQGLFA